MYDMGVIAGRFSTIYMVRAFQKALTVDFGNKSTFEHSHLLKIHDSYVKICESSCCFLAAFSIILAVNVSQMLLPLDYGTKSSIPM